MDKISWFWLSENPNAVHLLENNLDKVDWYLLSSNPNAISILERNLDEVYWERLSCNPNAIPILKNNLDKVDWDNLSRNPNALSLLFETDYLAMKNQMQPFAEELTKYVFNPPRVIRTSAKYEMDLDDYLEILS